MAVDFLKIKNHDTSTKYKYKFKHTCENQKFNFMNSKRQST